MPQEIVGKSITELTVHLDFSNEAILVGVIPLTGELIVTTLNGHQLRLRVSKAQLFEILDGITGYTKLFGIER